MKRVGNLFDKICDIRNIELADLKARKGKKNKQEIIDHDANRLLNLLLIQKSFKEGTYKTSPYTKYKIYEPKERWIWRLPYFPDRIVHHAIMNILEPIWLKVFTKDTYACIKGRGIHCLLKKLTSDIRSDEKGTRYCLKLDIRKFYPSINHRILKLIIRKKIKDAQTLKLLDEIIDSADCSADLPFLVTEMPIGVPIGNYLSLYFANLYLAYFDHWVREELKVKYYYRYADDIVILSDSKELLRNWCVAIKMYLKTQLNLQLKNNYLIFPVASRGIDFVGYVTRHRYTLIRKSIKKKIIKSLLKDDKLLSLTSYFGWLKYCNSKNFLKYIFKETNIWNSGWNGIKTNITHFKGKPIYIVNIVPREKYFLIQFVYKKKSYEMKSASLQLFLVLSFYRFPKLLTIH